MKYRLLPLLLGALLLGCSANEEPDVTLYLAVQRGDIEQIDRHLHWGTDINQVFPNGRYPIHDAADKGRQIMLRKFVEAGADLNVKDAIGRTPMDLAILGGRTQAAEILVKAGAAYDPTQLLLLAAQSDAEDRDIVRFLKTHGANLDSADDQGNTALLIAVQRSNHRLVRHLVEQGADVNVANKAGATALHLAETNGALEIQHYLLRNGAVRGTR